MSTNVLAADGQTVSINVHLDTGGSQNLASEHLLHNIKEAKDYGLDQIYMVTVNGNSPAYDRVGELNFTDEDNTPIIILCYIQSQSIKGHDNFVLISNDTLDDIQTDINYHSSMSRHVGVVPLRRLNKQPYHYSDTPRRPAPATDIIGEEQQAPSDNNNTSLLTVQATDTCQCTCHPRMAEPLTEVDFLRITGRKPRKSRRDNPKKDKLRFKVSMHTCFMSEVQLQGLLDRTKPSQGDEEAMDMTTIDGIRVSKYSIKAIKVGKNVSAQMRKELEEFNSKHVGEDSVFPTKNGAPKILEQFKDKPYALELRDEFTTGNKPKSLPTIKAMHYHGKPATCKVMEHFVRTTPVVEKCDDPRCFSRLVIVPKREPGSTKDSPPTSYRVTMDALINHCLKPVASTLPLATDEIKKLHAFRYFLKMDAMNAFWSIPLDEESKKLMAFQTHEGVFAWSRLTMGCRPASQVQQTAFHTAMDKYMPKEYRHRIALYADDMAAGANTLEELFEIYKALVITLAKAGIQIKSSKVEFGVEEITFHNYRVIGGTGPMANTTTPKDENLDPIKSCGIPQSITQLKALLGATQQMAQYVPYYALVAAPLHKLTRKDQSFPVGSKWIRGSDYDMAYYHVKSMMLDRPLYLWNKDNKKHLYFEVDSCDDGWGACGYQYATDHPVDAEAGKANMFSKGPKRIIMWVSKAWTPYEKQSLPIFYKETIARLLTLEHGRNLIETQEIGHGVTCYSDHLPGIKNSSLSNKGKLSTWRIHETSDLTAIVETLYKSGPTMAIADPLSRLARQDQQLDNLDLPLMLAMLLKELPTTVRNALSIRVNAEKDTMVATRIVQRWRKPSNPISNTVGSISDKIDFVISAPYADKLPLKVAELIRKDIPFAVLLPLSLLDEIDRTGKTSIDEDVRRKRLDMKLVIVTSLGQGWLINHPECKLSNSTHAVFFTACSSNEQLHQKGVEVFHKWTESTEGVKITPKTLSDENDIDVLCLRAVVRIQTVRLRLVRGLRKTQSQIPPTSYPVSARDKCNAKRRDGDEKE